MTTAIHEQQEFAGSNQATTGDGLERLKQLQTELLRQVSKASSKRQLLTVLTEFAPRYVECVAIFYSERDAQGTLLDAVQLHPVPEDDQTKRLTRQLSSICQTACRQGTVEVRRQELPARWIVAAPVVRQNVDPEVVGFIFSGDEPVQQCIMLAQIVASHLVLWHVLAANRESEQDARISAAVVELLDRLGAAPDLRSACFVLAAELQTYSKCQRVIVGLRHGGNGHCKLMAFSGVANFDLQSRAASTIEAAMNEAVLRNDVTIWPAADDHVSTGALAHKNVCSLEDVRAAISIPLRDQDGAAIGALLLLDDSLDKVTQSQRFLLASERSIARSLGIAIRLEGGWLVRLARTAGRTWRMWKARMALAAILAVAASMAIPFSHRLRCDCQIEPVTRRFIAAPFEGTLEKSLVKPGVVVREGELLARMDGREIRWKRASVAADQNQAIKKRDSAQAIHNYAEMQIAALEVERLDLELQLLDHRAENLEIKSPIAGIVVAGDLERAEGAPLTVGQTLYEIAPLAQMVVEVAIADADVSFIREGQPITVSLDAYPRDTWQVELGKVHPRSEIRDEKNVFIAEAELENPDGRLSPGMKGRATIATDRRPLGWILFHKPWEFVSKKLSW
jgi:multidrug efflux pump subunit AcrA (membrane-fusion protein)